MAVDKIKTPTMKRFYIWSAVICLTFGVVAGSIHMRKRADKMMADVSAELRRDRVASDLLLARTVRTTVARSTVNTLISNLIATARQSLASVTTYLSDAGRRQVDESQHPLPAVSSTNLADCIQAIPSRHVRESLRELSLATRSLQARSLAPFADVDDLIFNHIRHFQRVEAFAAGSSFQKRERVCEYMREVIVVVYEDALTEVAFLLRQTSSKDSTRVYELMSEWTDEMMSTKIL
jgi:hypothetical protein